MAGLADRNPIVDRVVMAALAIVIGGGSSAITATQLSTEAHEDMRLLTDKVYELSNQVAALDREVEGLRTFIDFRLTQVETDLDRLRDGPKGPTLQMPFDNLNLNPELESDPNGGYDFRG